MARRRPPRSALNLARVLLLALAATVGTVDLYSGCALAGGPSALTVSTAASLGPAFQVMKARYLKAHPDERIALNLGSSGVLRVQIERGAPVDVFAAAGLPPVQTLVKEGLIDSAEVRIFAGNRLVLIVPEKAGTHEQRAGTQKLGAGADSAGPRPINYLLDLTRPEVHRIAIGIETTVPAGLYAAQTLRHFRLFEKVRDKLIPAEDVRQVLNYVSEGSVDAGFVYSSDPGVGDPVRVVAVISDSAHDPILYAIAPLRESERAEEARRFIEFVTSAEGMSILSSHGFRSPPRADGESR